MYKVEKLVNPLESVEEEGWPAAAIEPFEGEIDPSEVEKAIQLGKEDAKELRDRLLSRSWPDPNIQYR